MRKIRVKTTKQREIISINTNATTFAEFKKAIQDSKYSEVVLFNNVKYIDRSTKVEYGSIEEALLPTGDCFLFMTPTKTDSGTFNFLSIEELKSLNYNELRKYGTKLKEIFGADLDLTKSTSEMFKEISDFTKEVNSDIGKPNIQRVTIQKATESTPSKELSPKEDDIIELLKNASNLIQKAIEIATKQEDLAIDGISYEEIQKEADRLEYLLNK